jgi:hypothetical protein
MNYSREIFVNYFVLFFIMVCVSIVFLIGLYYFTPNNYILINDKKDFKFIEEKKYIVLPNDIFILKNDKFLKIIFSKNELDVVGQESNLVIDDNINFIVKNWFKSQNLNYDSNELLQLGNTSELFYVNNTNEPVYFKVSFYDLI